MEFEIESGPNLIFVPITLFHPLSQSQKETLGKEVSHYFSGYLIPPTIVAEENNTGRVLIGIETHNGKAWFSALKELVSLFNAVLDDTDGRFPTLYSLLCISNHWIITPSNNPHILGTDDVADATLFVDLAMNAGYSTKNKLLINAAHQIFKNRTGNEPSSKEKADIKAHLIQRKMES